MSKKPKTYPAQCWVVNDNIDLLEDAPDTGHIDGFDFAADNTMRAVYAAHAVRYFGDIVAPRGEEPETLIGDLLANLMHLCDAAGIDFKDRLRNGRMHYDAEILGVL